MGLSCLTGMLAGSWLLVSSISPAEGLIKRSPPAGMPFILRVGESIPERLLDGNPHAGNPIFLPGAASKLVSAPQASHDVGGGPHVARVPGFHLCSSVLVGDLDPFVDSGKTSHPHSAKLSTAHCLGRFRRLDNAGASITAGDYGVTLFGELENRLLYVRKEPAPFAVLWEVRVSD